MAMFDKMYTVDEVAQLASVTSRTIRNYLKSGRLKGRKIGGKWRFTEQNVQDLLNGAMDDFSNIPITENIHNNLSNVSSIQNIPSYETAQPSKPISVPKRNQPIMSTFHVNEENIRKEEKKEPDIFDEFSSDSLFQEFADEAFDDRPNAVVNLSSNKKPIHQIPKNPNKAPKATTSSKNIPEKKVPQKKTISSDIKENNQMTQPTIDSIAKENIIEAEKQIKKSTQKDNTVKKEPISSKETNDIPSKTFSSIPQEKLYPDTLPTSTDSVNLTHIGKKVARFASEVHDCSKGNQICSMIDTSQKLQDAKKMIVKLADISRQESANGTLCQVYTEYDERFSIARYTLFGTTSFIERCLSILNNS